MNLDQSNKAVLIGNGNLTQEVPNFAIERLPGKLKIKVKTLSFLQYHISEIKNRNMKAYLLYTKGLPRWLMIKQHAVLSLANWKCLPPIYLHSIFAILQAWVVGTILFLVFIIFSGDFVTYTN